uniref:ABC transmembrane type-1 domain-containing protein n=1 Tax=Steinernema glaseri TaxID=37863 RepID=A0A1I8ABL8_9BILA
MNEILNGIRVLKMYAWEEAFSEVVDKVRRTEIRKMRENSIYQSMSMGLFWVGEKLMIFFAIITFLYFGNTISARHFFVAIVLYNACRLPCTLYFLISIQLLCELRMSVERIQKFLELEDHKAISSSSEADREANGA